MKAVRDSVRFVKIASLEEPSIITLNWNFSNVNKMQLGEDITRHFEQEHVAPALAEEMAGIVNTMIDLKSDLLLEQADCVQVNKGGLELLRLNNLDSQKSGVGLILDMHAVRKANV